MPYIRPEARLRLNAQIEELSTNIVDAGELNYCLSRLAAGFADKDGLTYLQIAIVTGVLTNVLQEWNRRVVINYEEEKKNRNGDIPEYSSQ